MDDDNFDFSVAALPAPGRAGKQEAKCGGRAARQPLAITLRGKVKAGLGAPGHRFCKGCVPECFKTTCSAEHQS